VRAGRSGEHAGGRSDAAALRWRNLGKISRPSFRARLGAKRSGEVRAHALGSGAKRRCPLRPAPEGGRLVSPVSP
jgi:hypothetical protein